MEKLVKVTSKNLTKIYSMGYDVWGEGKNYASYLNDCENSVKYKKGTWYALKVDRELVSSCILYSLSNNTIGIGSVATSSEKRGLGYASLLIKEILAENKEYSFLLWSDIAPSFYENLGFTSIDKVHQPYEEKALMFYPTTFKMDLDNLPSYF